MFWGFLLLLSNGHSMLLLTPQAVLKGTASHAVSLLDTHTLERPSLRGWVPDPESGTTSLGSHDSGLRSEAHMCH